jgi:amino acid permease
MTQTRRSRFARFVMLAPIVLLSICVAFVYGCLASGQKKPALVALECRQALLEPYLGELTPGVVRSTLAGNASPLLRILTSLGLSIDEARDVAKAWHECVPKPVPEPGPDAGALPGEHGSGQARVESF